MASYKTERRVTVQKNRAQKVCIFLITPFQDGFLFAPNHPFPGDQAMTLSVRFTREEIQALRNQTKVAKGCPDPVSLPGVTFSTESHSSTKKSPSAVDRNTFTRLPFPSLYNLSTTDLRLK